MDIVRIAISGVLGTLIVQLTEFSHIVNIVIFGVTFAVVALIFEAFKIQDNSNKTEDSSINEKK